MKLKNCLFICLCIFNIATTQANELMVVNYGQIEFGSKLYYQEALVKKILDITATEFGPYQLNIVSEAKDWSVARYRRNLSTGRLINMSWTATTPYDPKSKGHIRIDYPIMNNVNGYRLFIVQKDKLEDFAKIKSLAQLRDHTAGQGAGWVEVDVFQHNKIPLVQNIHLNNLYTMLDQNRFDFLPLAVLEINEEMKKIHSIHPDFRVEQTLLLYYPSPLYFQVSHKHPRLAKRIEAGMKHITQSGELLELFNQYFAEELEKFNLHERHLITIENPFIGDESDYYTPYLLNKE